MKFSSLLVSLLVLGSTAALADEPVEVVEKAAVRNRLFPVEGRWEVGANVGFSLMNKLTEHYNFSVSAAFNPKDWIGFEARAGAAISGNTALARTIQTDMFANNTIGNLSDAADLWQLRGHGVIGVRLQPIYGKLNLMAQLPIHFQFYLWAGGGLGVLQRESVVFCAMPAGAATCGAFLTENKVNPVVSVALGVRFFLPAQGHSLKLEVRDWSYADSYRINVSRATGMGGTQNPFSLTNLVQLDLGYAFIF